MSLSVSHGAVLGGIALFVFAGYQTLRRELACNGQLPSMMQDLSRLLALTCGIDYSKLFCVHKCITLQHT